MKHRFSPFWRALLLVTLVGALSPWSIAEPKVTSFQRESLIIIQAENPNLCPETITLSATLVNMASSRKAPFTFELAPGATEELCRFTIIEPGTKSNWNYNWLSHMGSRNAKHDDKVVYALPYPSGKSYTVIQGYLGAFSHTGELSYSIDWKMPEGSEVCAARDGIVLKTKADSNEGGPIKDFTKKANVLMIGHSDNTIGEYVHLKQNGIRVKVGDRVKAGDVVALSGNTGFSTKPHLHFLVYVPVDGTKFRSFPVRFRTESVPADTLREGKTYPAP